MVIKIPLYLFQFLLIVFPILLDISEHFYNHLILLIVPLQNSVNARYQTIPYPWLVFGEKVKVNTVFIRDSTGISDSILILFGGTLSRGAMAEHLKMLEGYIDFFMDPSLAECYWKLKEEFDKLLQKKVSIKGIF
ncbi:DExH-box ATP-dependent RNA helicase DExH5, mitochondrial [Vitis vinifera]|uniref:DExH-box ATP-dependent RNA helicase DExH5, mitochondrial n=1 Tax=Vitis vinifera TaxID=29760 RepID=A0A438JWC8_VITVI|nr:DExH-box ATP-dependent RNA helicase DExH5, mitochondrial [Vitis vinifera]